MKLEGLVNKLGPGKLGAVGAVLVGRAVDGSVPALAAVGAVESARVAAVQRAPVVEATAAVAVAIPVVAAEAVEEAGTDVLHAGIGAFGELLDALKLSI